MENGPQNNYEGDYYLGSIINDKEVLTIIGGVN